MERSSETDGLVSLAQSWQLGLPGGGQGRFEEYTIFPGGRSHQWINAVGVEFARRQFPQASKPPKAVDL